MHPPRNSPNLAANGPLRAVGGTRRLGECFAIKDGEGFWIKTRVVFEKAPSNMQRPVS